MKLTSLPFFSADRADKFGQLLPVRGQYLSGLGLLALLILIAIIVFSGPVRAESILIRGGADGGQLQMDADMWNETLQAELNPGFFLGMDYLASVPADNLVLGAGGEVAPLRSSAAGTGENFHLFNLTGLLQYDLPGAFVRTRAGFSFIYPPASQLEQALTVSAGPSVSVGAGFAGDEGEVKIFYAFNSSYITDRLLDKSERLDIHRLGISLGFNLGVD